MRARWRTTSFAAGWPFPGDWASPAVDRVCEAAVGAGDLRQRLGELGGERAGAGVGLDGTLQDLAAMHAACADAEDTGLVVADPDAVPAWMIRVTASGWADGSAGKAIARESTDALTGLTTVNYLRTRLHEVYREAASARREPRAGYALLTVTIEVPEDGSGWNRAQAMILTAAALQRVFDSGQTLSLLRPSTATVLAARGDRLHARRARFETDVPTRLANDPSLRTACVRVSDVALPATHQRAWQLLDCL
ncbi:hypothetical protein GIY23_18935 [Allosaccharopolyspora coralli]|uniref:GGDEF domain-containing protein n=1 Tax=Allosaccharopolyspora coralli TaxID=2665642 RepID=A0A5Q3QCW1_9PSEU|nr:hypothetical protein GIY23_18935 [Allosaccharopolyspora coralli]